MNCNKGFGCLFILCFLISRLTPYLVSTSYRMIGSDACHSNYVDLPGSPLIPPRQKIPLSGVNGFGTCEILGLYGDVKSWYLLFTDFTGQSQKSRLRMIGVNQRFYSYEIPNYGFMPRGALSSSGLAMISSMNFSGVFDVRTGLSLGGPSKCITTHPSAFDSTGKMMYCYSSDNPGSKFTHIHAYETTSWTLRWRASLNFTVFHRGDGSPITIEEVKRRVWVSVSLGEPRALSFDMDTGKFLGEYARGVYGNNIMQQPRLSPDGSILFLTVCQWFFRAYRVSDGELLWEYKFEDSEMFQSPSTYAISPDGNVLYPFTRYSPDPKQFMRYFDGKSGKVIWEFVAAEGSERRSDPSGQLYVDVRRKKVVWVDRDTNVFVVDIVTGKGKRLPEEYKMNNTLLCGIMDSRGTLYMNKHYRYNNSIEIMSIHNELVSCC